MDEVSTWLADGLERYASKFEELGLTKLSVIKKLDHKGIDEVVAAVGMQVGHALDLRQRIGHNPALHKPLPHFLGGPRELRQSSVSENIAVSTPRHSAPARQNASPSPPKKDGAKKQNGVCYLHSRPELKKINLQEQTFIVDAWITVFFRKQDIFDLEDYPELFEEGFKMADLEADEERLKKLESKMPLGKLTPIMNSVESEKNIEVTYSCKGDVIWCAMHIQNAEVTEGYELQRFPFDRQFLKMKLGIRTGGWDVSHVVPWWLPLRPDSRWNAAEQRDEPPQFMPGFLWIMHDGKRVISDDCYSRPAISKATALIQVEYNMLNPWVRYDMNPQPTICLRVARKRQYYFWKCFLPVFLVVLCTLSSFFFVDDLGNRLAVNVGLLLAVTQAQTEMLEDRLPVSEHITFLESYILLGVVIIVISMAENVLVCSICKESAPFVDMALGLTVLVVWIACLAVILVATFDPTGARALEWLSAQKDGAEGPVEGSSSDKGAKEPKAASDAKKPKLASVAKSTGKKSTWRSWCAHSAHSAMAWVGIFEAESWKERFEQEEADQDPGWKLTQRIDIQCTSTRKGLDAEQVQPGRKRSCSNPDRNQIHRRELSQPKPAGVDEKSPLIKKQPCPPRQASSPATNKKSE
jgi:hypothetical protein